MRHVYIHVPFCRRRCTYCDFSIAVRRAIPGERFVETIQQEIEAHRRAGRLHTQPLDTIYFGGGTPSLLDPAYLASLREMVIEDLGGGGEIRETTIEVNPDDVTEERIEAWEDVGVNRISLGVQSFDRQVLEWMHRTHDANQAERAILLLQAAEVFSISVDIIFALPPAVGGDPIGDLNRVLQMGVPHVSAYGLTVEGGTALGHWVNRGAVAPVEPELYAEQFIAIDALAVGAGYEHYEVSNYARPGHPSRHNSAYWEGESYLGLGPSAHSYHAGRRWWNRRDWAAYDRCLREGADPVAEEEMLTADQRRIEATYLGLRTRRGLVSSEGLSRPALERAVDAGWLAVAGGVIRATPEGWLRLDELVTVLTT